jgi:caspase 7
MEEKMYNMNHDQRGIALVININAYNSNRNEVNESKCFDKDVVNLKKTLDYLEFDFKLRENLKASQIRDEIQTIADEDHTNSDCFLCVVISHDFEHKIMASDREEISLEEIMKPIKSCKSLENKPKLFFFQACRGNEKVDRSDLRSTKTETDSDLLVYNSILPNHHTCGTVDQGTFFMKSLCNEFNEAYKNLPNNKPLSEMILNLNKSVRESGAQLEDPKNFLMADVNFTPKQVSKN